MDKLKQWVALTLVGVLAVLAAGWFLLVSPKRVEAASLRQQATAQQSANGVLRNQLAVLKAQAENLPQEQAKLAVVAAKLPDNPAQPELLRSLAAAAVTAGVELVSVAPGALVPVAGVPAVVVAPAATEDPSAAPKAAVTAVAASTAGLLFAMPVTLSVAGGYNEVQQFLISLEELSRALRVTGLTVTPGTNPVAAVTPGAAAPSLEDGRHLLTNITGTVYVAAGAGPVMPVVVPASAVTPAPVK